MKQTTEIPTSNSMPLDIAKEFGAGVTQELILFVLLALVITIRDKVKSSLKLNYLSNTYFKTNSLNDQVKQSLIEIKDIAQADRVILLHLHNGDAYFGKFRQLKVTMTHQYVNNGITEINKVIGLPITYIHREFDLLRKNKELQWIPTIDAEEPCKKYLEKMGVELYCSKLLYNNLDIPVAIFGLHYCSHDYIAIVNDKMINDVLDKKLKNLTALIS